MTTTPFTPCRFKVGDKVSLERCDKHQPPNKKLGSPAEVKHITRGVCESGWMVTVKSEHEIVTLDQNWLKEI